MIYVLWLGVAYAVIGLLWAAFMALAAEGQGDPASLADFSGWAAAWPYWMWIVFIGSKS